MVIEVKISGSVSDEFDDGNIVDLENDLNDTLRIEYGATDVSVQVIRG